MMPPYGTFFLASRSGVPVGCVGLEGDGAGIAAVNQLWGAPPERGHRLASHLSRAVKDAA